ncbi:MAG: NosD domain-containing protein [Bacteroidota bacterium]
MKKIICLLLLMQQMHAHATNFTVTNTADTGNGSLRAAVQSANASMGVDNIFFNIPPTDPNYNATSGTWKITLLSPLPYLLSPYKTIDGSSQTNNQGNTNPSGPEIVIDGGGTVDHAFLLVSTANTIKGLCITGFTYGILLNSTSVSSTTITQCFIGIDPTGSTAAPNTYGIAITTGVTGTNISNCIISGNTESGVLITDAGNTTITACAIGTNNFINLAVPNKNGISLNNSYGNTIGGSSPASRNFISGNTQSGILINAAASVNNTILGNFIGTDFSGTLRLSNGSGIILMNAPNNTIGGNTAARRNIISGNTDEGIVLNGTGTRNNTIIGNYIGTDTSGAIPLYNHGGITLISHSNSNLIGGSASGERNIISGNTEIGVYIEASDSNHILGNYIGPDKSGMLPLMHGDTMFQSNGIEFNTVSMNNICGGTNAGERNVISGNRVYGVIYYGQVSNNSTIGNYIGTDASGNHPMPNATGICVDGASNHNNIEKNLLSGNISYGIFIVTTGTFYNSFKGNLVGTNAAGTDTLPNDCGLLLGGGAKYNQIGGVATSDRNVFSGNHYEGILIADNGTNYNTIENNFIGTNVGGLTALPNLRGIGLSSNPHANTFKSNVISGNKSFGVLLYEHADSNVFYLNKIGLGSDSITPLGNHSAGIALSNAVQHTVIGAPTLGNAIANNDSSGIVIEAVDSKYNTISGNAIYNNQFLGIEIFPPGPNPNDVGDSDDGANNLMNYPEISTAGYFQPTGLTTIMGHLDSPAALPAAIEVFKAMPDSFNCGEGAIFLGQTYTNLSGDFCILVGGLQIGDTITATATDTMGNTSEFSTNFVVSVGNSIADINSSNNFKVFPNPATKQCNIYADLPATGEVRLECSNLFGLRVNTYTEYVDKTKPFQHVISLENNLFMKGIYIVQLFQNDKLIGVLKLSVVQ